MFVAWISDIPDGTKRSRRRRDGEDFALGAPMASLRIRMGGSGSSAVTKKTSPGGVRFVGVPPNISQVMTMTE